MHAILIDLINMFVTFDNLYISLKSFELSEFRRSVSFVYMFFIAGAAVACCGCSVLLIFFFFFLIFCSSSCLYVQVFVAVSLCLFFMVELYCDSFYVSVLPNNCLRSLVMIYFLSPAKIM